MLIININSYHEHSYDFGLDDGLCKGLILICIVNIMPAEAAGNSGNGNVDDA